MHHSNDIHCNRRRRGVRGLPNRWQFVAAAALLLWAMPQQGLAWGHEGHRLTALVAEHSLTPETKAEIAELLHGETLADVASWADDYRAGHPETARWHFVDIPSSAASFDRMRDCPVSKADPISPWRDCLTDRILYFEGRLGDASLSDAERATALKFVVHLVGDIHQPLHTLADQDGGNGIRVNVMPPVTCPSKCNLHQLWDSALIDAQGLSEKKYEARLLDEIQSNQWERMAGGEPTTWANISHHYAVDALVPNNAVITREYVVEESKIVDAELALGGLRLARVLNHILGTTAHQGEQAPAMLLQPEPATRRP